MTAPVNACIGLGANLGRPQAALRDAVQALAALPDSRLLAASGFYRSKAWGRTDQPDFVNAAVLLRTRLAPQALLAHMLEIERLAGRRRDADDASTRWGPRVLDLDLLLYGGQVIDVPGLRVPHPYLHQRAFALLPLAQIAPDEPFPGHGSVAQALHGVDASGLQALDDA